ncbi:PilZ domain-containing protein [Caldalkalibacillus mannanilyticus]|uniref:PilZ domain-containing protein n=1 Tax=Caldalkalibacillus mannanilyticus TaxID=1418 RepID=UPI00046A8A6E|nr:PilZ domain-containing protein [Caldalkalibacillus mannanilyticus]
MKERMSARVVFTSNIRIPFTIAELHGKPVKANSTVVSIKDISMHGLQFYSSLNFPVNEDLILDFNLYRDQLQSLRGYIVWKQQHGEEYKYGVQFTSVPAGFLHYFISMAGAQEGFSTPLTEKPAKSIEAQTDENPN